MHPLTPLLARYFPDDAFFYIKTAANLTQGKGPTFDGFQATSGYHPLYLLLLELVSNVSLLTGDRGILTVFVLDLALGVAGVVVIDRLLRRLAFGRPARALVALGLVGPVLFRDFGMDSRLLFPLAWGIVALSARVSPSTGTRRLLLVGTVGALVTLARLDAALLVAALALWASRQVATPGSGGVARWRPAALLLAPTAAALAIYLTFNQLSYGHPLPISGWIRTYPPGSAALASILDFPYDDYRATILGLCALTAIAHLILGRRLGVAGDPASTVRSGLLHTLAAFVLVYLFVLHTLYRGGIPTWALTLPLTLGLVLASDLLERFVVPRLRAQLGAVAAIAATASVLLITAAASLALVPWTAMRNNHDLAIDFALDLRQSLPREARVFQVDASGLVGYVSERAVVNGDGLIGSWEYQNALAADELPAWLEEHDVSYVAWDDYRDGKLIQISVPRRGRVSLVLTFEPPPRIVTRHGRFVLLAPSPGSLRSRPADQLAR